MGLREEIAGAARASAEHELDRGTSGSVRAHPPSSTALACLGRERMEDDGSG